MTSRCFIVVLAAAQDHASVKAKLVSAVAHPGSAEEPDARMPTWVVNITSTPAAGLIANRVSESLRNKPPPTLPAATPTRTCTNGMTDAAPAAAKRGPPMTE